MGFMETVFGISGKTRNQRIIDYHNERLARIYPRHQMAESLFLTRGNFATVSLEGGFVDQIYRSLLKRASQDGMMLIRRGTLIYIVHADQYRSAMAETQREIDKERAEIDELNRAGSGYTRDRMVA